MILRRRSAASSCLRRNCCSSPSSGAARRLLSLPAMALVDREGTELGLVGSVRLLGPSRAQQRSQPSRGVTQQGYLKFPKKTKVTLNFSNAQDVRPSDGHLALCACWATARRDSHFSIKKTWALHGRARPVSRRVCPTPCTSCRAPCLCLAPSAARASSPRSCLVSCAARASRYAPPVPRTASTSLHWTTASR